MVGALGDNMKEESSGGSKMIKQPVTALLPQEFPGEQLDGGSHCTHRTTVALAGAQKLNSSFRSPCWETGSKPSASAILW